MKFVLSVEETDYNDQLTGSKTTKEFYSEYLYDVIHELNVFLKAAGFEFDGQLDIVEQENHLKDDDVFISSDSMDCATYGGGIPSFDIDINTSGESTDDVFHVRV